MRPSVPSLPEHVTNGDSAFTVICAPGPRVVWRDVLHDVGVAPSLGSDLVLWFEHDLYDQLQLMEVLAVAPAGAWIQAIISDEYLGELSPSRGPELWEQRQPVSESDRASAAALYDSFVARRPMSFSGGGVLRFLGPALERLQQDKPWTSAAIGLTERRLLSTLLSGPLDRWELFGAYQALEEPKFLGDSSAWARLDALPDLVTRTGDTYELTDLARSLLANVPQ
jgi:hypothetical protein